MKKQDLLVKLGMVGPFENYEPNSEAKLWGWNGIGPIFAGMVNEIKPALVIEVGSWMGQSSVSLAAALKEQGLVDSTLICVDTWLGSKEHWTEVDLRAHLGLEHGYPTFYFNYLSNIANAGVSEHVFPLPLPSQIAAEYLKTHGLMAELIYLDASHQEKDVYNDLQSYWQLLSAGGMMFGDDYDDTGVSQAVLAFSAEIGAPVGVSGINWFIRKRSV